MAQTTTPRHQEALGAPAFWVVSPEKREGQRKEMEQVLALQRHGVWCTEALVVWGNFWWYNGVESSLHWGPVLLAFEAAAPTYDAATLFRLAFSHEYMSLLQALDKHVLTNDSDGVELTRVETQWTLRARESSVTATLEHCGRLWLDVLQVLVRVAPGAAPAAHSVSARFLRTLCLGAARMAFLGMFSAYAVPRTRDLWAAALPLMVQVAFKHLRPDVVKNDTITRGALADVVHVCATGTMLGLCVSARGITPPLCPVRLSDLSGIHDNLLHVARQVLADFVSVPEVVGSVVDDVLHPFVFGKKVV
jgi:hypothetical protein